MSKQTYRGSCHCGAVRYEADIDLAAGSSRCNCSYCAKARNWSTMIKPDALRKLAGHDQLTVYQFGTKQGHHAFCRHCGVRPYSWGNVPEIGGEFVSINLATLDDVDPAALAAIPIKYCDGLANNWWNPPAVTQHL
ncbi:MAG TPA: GFA family protein [Kofleriaceae bacterium]|nr:GFA family protein [Kofleriaceae bacterium]